MNTHRLIYTAFIFLVVFVCPACISDTINEAPGAVTLISPQNGALEVALNDTLNWQETIDPNGDLVKYDVYFGTEPNPETVVSMRQDSTIFLPSLLAGTSYYWKILAQDGAEGISESETWSFSTISTNQAPGEITLLSPANEPIVEVPYVEVNAELTWQAAIDPDGDEVTYDVYFGTEAIPSKLVSIDQSGTSYSPKMESATTYYWMVLAKDDKGASRDSEIWGFTTKNNPPAEVILIAPENAPFVDLGTVPLNPTLLWQEAIDPDGDSVVYNVYLDTNPFPLEKISSEQVDTSFTPTLLSNTLYYWRVVAVDNKWAVSNSEVWGFRTTYVNQVPGVFNLISPANTTVNIALSADLRWEASIDPEGGAISYDVYFGTDASALMVVSEGQLGISYSPSLARNTNYYWKVVAKDLNGGIRESAVWGFRTILF